MVVIWLLDDGAGVVGEDGGVVVDTMFEIAEVISEVVVLLVLESLEHSERTIVLTILEPSEVLVGIVVTAMLAVL